MFSKKVAAPSPLELALSQQAMALSVFDEAREHLTRSNDLLAHHQEVTVAQIARLQMESVQAQAAIERNNKVHAKITEIVG